MAKARKGDVVQIYCKSLAADGATFGTTEGGEPLQFTLGDEQAIDALNDAVLGMQKGEKKTVTVPPEKGFGPRQPGKTYRIKRTALPKDVRVGDRFSSQAGEKVFPVWVAALESEFATVDANHPLKGQTLVLEIELVGINAKK